MNFSAVIKRERSPSSDGNDRDRSKRGDRPSRFGPRSSSPNSGGMVDPSERRIFVSNIAYEYRWQDLKDLFRSEVGEVSFVKLFTDEDTKPRGCGIVEFASVDSVQKAVEKMHCYESNGRRLIVKEEVGVERDNYGRIFVKTSEMFDKSPNMGVRGRNRNMRDASSFSDEQLNQWDSSNSSYVQQSRNAGETEAIRGNTYGLSPQFLEDLGINGTLVTRIFVANLDYKVDQKKFKEVFKMAGRIINAELNVDRDGKSRGFGIIEYEHPVEAVQAISLFNNQLLFERKMAVRMDRAEVNLEWPLKLPEGLRSIGMGLGANGVPLRDVARNLPSLVHVSGGLSGSVVDTNLTAAALLNVVNNASSLGVGMSGGLQLGLGSIGNSLQTSNGGISNLNSPNTNLSAGNAYGNAGMNLSNGVGNPSLLGNAPSFGDQLFSSGSSVCNYGNAGRDLGSSGEGGNFNIGAVGDRDSRRNAVSVFSSNAARPGGGEALINENGNRLSDTIIVKNLPTTTTWQTLRGMFRYIGDVQYAEMTTKDMGLVRFALYSEAVLAILMMDRKRLNGQNIEVVLF